MSPTKTFTLQKFKTTDTRSAATLKTPTEGSEERGESLDRIYEGLEVTGARTEFASERNTPGAGKAKGRDQKKLLALRRFTSQMKKHTS